MCGAIIIPKKTWERLKEENAKASNRGIDHANVLSWSVSTMILEEKRRGGMINVMKTPLYFFLFFFLHQPTDRMNQLPECARAFFILLFLSPSFSRLHSHPLFLFLSLSLACSFALSLLLARSLSLALEKGERKSEKWILGNVIRELGPRQCRALHYHFGRRPTP